MDVHENFILVLTRYLQFMIEVYFTGKYTDCNGVLFILGLVKCKRVFEDLADFGVFVAVIIL